MSVEKMVVIFVIVTSEREVPMDRQIIMLRRFGIML